MNYKQFIAAVRSKGGIWLSNDIVFSVMQSYYTASYKPTYPERSEKDQCLTYNHFTNMWHYEGTKE